MRRQIGPQTDAPGQDSFQDVVANLVGILVILVMVIGVRTRGALNQQTQEGPEAAELAELEERLGRAASHVAALTTGAQQTHQQVVRLDQLAALRQIERDRLQLKVLAAERKQRDEAVASRQQQRQQQALAHELAAARQQLEQLHRQIEQTERASSEPVVLPHMPTPLARTVFGHEEHFRLADGHLAYVPLAEIVDELKREAMRKIPQLQTVPQLTQTLGQRHGFHLRYSLRRRQVVLETEAGRMVREIAELAWFELLPTSEPMGQPVAELLAEGSSLDQRLQRWNPDETIITMWTYPNSYAEFRTLKDHLQQRGFLVAGRPLPEHQPITGSPDGSRSVAQ